MKLPSTFILGPIVNYSKRVTQWSMATSKGVMAVSLGPDMVIKYWTQPAAESNGGLIISHHYVITGD